MAQLQAQSDQQSVHKYLFLIIVLHTLLKSVYFLKCGLVLHNNMTCLDLAKFKPILEQTVYHSLQLRVQLLQLHFFLLFLCVLVFSL